METPEFKNLLFKTAVLVKSNDGRVHEESVREIQSYAKIASYFKDVDTDAMLKAVTLELKEQQESTIDEYLKELDEANLSLIQELLLLEIIMRIIHASEKLDQHEIEFLQAVRTRLKVYNEIILERFGEIDYLVSEKYTDVKEAEEGDLINEIKSPDLRKFNDIDLNDSNM